MREIKYRAYLKDSKQVVEVRHISFFKGQTVVKIYDEPMNEEIWFNLEELELLQYTGLKDKNGVEIYEGDIVEIKDHSFQKKPGDYTGIEIDGFYPVTYTERMELVAGQWLLMHQLPYITVVGNIYEHPHLLERD